jgi:hypothetical protein
VAHGDVAVDGAQYGFINVVCSRWNSGVERDDRPREAIRCRYKYRLRLLE